MKLLSGIIELKTGWFVQLPYPMTKMEMSCYRFAPLAKVAGAAMPIISTVAPLAGPLLSAFGTYKQGSAASDQGKLEQQIYNYNATLKEREAEAERERARVEALHFKKEGEALLGEQQVNLAKGGVLSSVGTPALLLEETQKNLDADRLQILKNGYLAGSFRESEAEGLRFQGRSAKAAGSNAKRGATLSSFGTLLTGAGQAGYMKYRMA